MPFPPHIFPNIVRGVVLLGLVLALWLAYRLGLNRAKRAFGRLALARKLEEEADRDRLRLTLDKTQQDLAQAAVDLERMSEERRRAFSDRAHFEQEATEAQELLRDAAAVRATIEAELRRLRESNRAARDVKAALDSEVRLRQETDKALAAAGAAAAKAHQQLAEANAEIAMERRQAADFARQHEQAQARLAQQASIVRELTAHVEQLERRGEDMTDIEQQLVVAQSRVTSLEHELAKVTEVASTVGEVRLDREELEARLEMAATAARIARKEAERYRSQAIEQSQKLTENKQEVAQLRAATRQREQQLAEGQAAIVAALSLQNEVQELKAKVQEQNLSISQLTARAAAAQQSAEQQRRVHEALELELRQLRVCQQSYNEQSVELSSARAKLEAEQHRTRELTEHQAAGERLEKDLAAARAQLLFREEQTEELDRLRDLVKGTRDGQKAHLEAERRLLATQAELRSVRLELEAVLSQKEKRPGLSEASQSPSYDSVRAKSLGEELEAQRAIARELRGRWQVASAQLSDLERLRADNSALRDEVSELRQCKDDSAALAQLRSEHRQLRLEWELSARRVSELSAEREELIALRGDADQVRMLDHEVTELRRRERALEAQIYGLGQTPETEVRRSMAPIAIAGTRAAEIEAGLAPLVAAGQRTVVLADHQGFPIASSGELEPQDGLAAFSAVAGDAARNAETLLPVGSVQSVWVIDKNRTQISCRFFNCGSESFTLSTLGQATLSTDDIDAVLLTVTATMTQLDAAAL